MVWHRICFFALNLLFAALDYFIFWGTAVVFWPVMFLSILLFACAIIRVIYHFLLPAHAAPIHGTGPVLVNNKRHFEHVAPHFPYMPVHGEQHQHYHDLHENKRVSMHHHPRPVRRSRISRQFIEQQKKEILTRELNKKGTTFDNITMFMASKHYKRTQKGKNHAFKLVENNQFDDFLAQIRSYAQSGQAWQLHFVFRMRLPPHDTTSNHYNFGTVCVDPSRRPCVRLLICDPVGISTTEMLGKGKHSLHQTTDLIAKVKIQLGEENVVIYTNATPLQASVYGCSFFSSFGCFDLSNVEDYLPEGDEDIFAYMDRKVTEDHHVLRDLRKTYKSNYDAYRSKGVIVSLLPHHVIRNQHAIGGSVTDQGIEKTHDHGLCARAWYDRVESTLPLKGRHHGMPDHTVLHTPLHTSDIPPPETPTLINTYKRHRVRNRSTNSMFNCRLNHKIKQSKQDVMHFLDQPESVVQQHVQAVLL